MFERMPGFRRTCTHHPNSFSAWYGMMSQQPFGGCVQNPKMGPLPGLGCSWRGSEICHPVKCGHPHPKKKPLGSFGRVFQQNLGRWLGFILSLPVYLSLSLSHRTNSRCAGPSADQLVWANQLNINKRIARMWGMIDLEVTSHIPENGTFTKLYGVAWCRSSGIVLIVGISA